jgi:hypothetical protein
MMCLKLRNLKLCKSANVCKGIVFSCHPERKHPILTQHKNWGHFCIRPVCWNFVRKLCCYAGTLVGHTYIALFSVQITMLLKLAVLQSWCRGVESVLLGPLGAVNVCRQSDSACDRNETTCNVQQKSKNKNINLSLSWAEEWFHSFLTSTSYGSECSTLRSGRFTPGKQP